MRVRLLYPLLFSTLPILTVLARNPGGSTLGDAAGLVAVMLIAWAITYALIAVIGGAGFTQLTSLIVLAAVMWFYAYQPLRGLYHLQRGTAAMVVTGAAGAILAFVTVTAIRWVARRPRYLDRVTTFFAIT